MFADRCNIYIYQYLLDDKKWSKINKSKNWVKKFPGSLGMAICGMYEIDNIFYVASSKGISTLNNEFYKFPSNNEHWWSTSCRVGNNILVIQCNRSDEIESKCFDLTSKQWSAGNIETKRIKFAAVEHFNQVWIVGGEERDDDGQYKTLNTLQIYDPVSKTTTLSPLKMVEARGGHKVVVYDDNLFVFGGFGENFELLNTVEMYSFETNKFTSMAPMKIARCNFACCRVGNLVYIIGGWTNLETKNSVEVYNLDTNTWTEEKNFPVCKYDYHACAVSNKLE